MLRLLPCRWWTLLIVMAALSWSGARATWADAPPVNFNLWTVPQQPSPVGVDEEFGIGLQSKITAAPPNGESEENLVTESQQWYITSVSYSTDDQNWTSEWSGQGSQASVANFFDISISGGIGGGTISGTVGYGGQAGFYLIAFTSDAYVSANVDGQTKSGPVSASGSTTQPAVKVDITYTGPIVGQANGDSNTIVTGLHTSVHAGWPIQLGVLVAPADLGIGFTWTISGTGPNGSAAIKNWVLAADHSSASVTALTSPANTILNMFGPYYYVASGNQTASVSLQGVNVPAAKTTFSVAKPQGPAMKLTTQTTSVGGLYPIPNTAPPQDGLSFGEAVVGKEGIQFTLTAPPPNFQGNIEWVQVYTYDHTAKPLNAPALVKSGTGLDVIVPPPSSLTQNDSPYQNIVAGVAYVSVDDRATMWPMYVPSKAGSIPVPTLSVGWFWKGKLLSNRTTQGLGNSPSPSGTKTDTYPVWSLRLSDLQWH